MNSKNNIFVEGIKKLDVFGGKNEGCSEYKIKENLEEYPLGVILYLCNMYYGGQSMMVSSAELHHAKGLDYIVNFVRKFKVGSFIACAQIWDAYDMNTDTKLWKKLANQLRKRRDVFSCKDLVITKETIKEALSFMGLSA